MGKNPLKRRTDIQAVVLAGGLGTRLRCLTRRTPKPMILLHGRPFLWHLLKNIKTSGISDILILTGYLGEKIEAYFGDGSSLGLRIVYSKEQKPLGTGGALLFARRKLGNEFILFNGDTYLPIDIYDLVNRFHKEKKSVMMVAYDNSKKAFRANMKINAEGLVTAYDKLNPASMTHTDAGVLVLKKTALRGICRSFPCSLENDIYPLWIKNKQIAAFAISQRFYDMGSAQGLLEMERILS